MSVAPDRRSRKMIARCKTINDRQALFLLTLSLIIPNAENGSDYTPCKGVRPQDCPICGRKEVEGSISVVLSDWGCGASVCKSCWDSGFKQVYLRASAINPHNPTVENLTKEKLFHDRERRRTMKEAKVAYDNYLKTLRI